MPSHLLHRFIAALLAAFQTVGLWLVWESFRTLTGPGLLYCIMTLPTSARVREAAKPSYLHTAQSSCSSPCNPAVMGWRWGQHVWNVAGMGTAHSKRCRNGTRIYCVGWLGSSTCPRVILYMTCKTYKQRICIIQIQQLWWWEKLSYDR